MKACPRAAAVSVPDPMLTTVNPCLCWRLPDTQRQVWLSLLCGHCSFPLGSGVHKVLFVPSKTLCFSSPVDKLHNQVPLVSRSDSLGILSPFAGSPGWEVCWGPRNFVTLWELFWYNCFPVCGSPTWQLYIINGDLLQEDLCHMPHLPLLLPCPSGRPLDQQVLLIHASAGDPQTLKDRSCSVSCGSHCSFPWVLMCTRFCMCSPSISGGYEVWF